ncbi:unnamed protein product, partial [Allacma fusca]
MKRIRSKKDDSKISKMKAKVLEYELKRQKSRQLTDTSESDSSNSSGIDEVFPDTQVMTVDPVES